MPRYTVVRASFEQASHAVGLLPLTEDGIEVAVVGRSNVGKSSLLGQLLGRPKLVRVSKTPGQTKTLSLFRAEVRDTQHDITRVFGLVDLPGYGFAKLPGAERERLAALISDYLSHRDSLRGLLCLVDARHPPAASDRALARDLVNAPFPRLFALTKADQVPRGTWPKTQTDLANVMGAVRENVVLTSSRSNVGIDTLWERIWELPEF